MTLSKSRPRHGQLGSRKSTDGCITCKIRKVKCDELRPACRRCLATGRKCDGYVRVGNVGCPPRTNSAIVSVKRPSVYANFEHVEVQSFEFFMRRIVPGSSRMVDEHFWRQLIPQLSHSDPVIWDAVIALSHLIQHSQYSRYSRSYRVPGSKTAPVINEEHRRAMTWYGKSIANLRRRLKQATARSATALISCILYICIEILQDNVAEAVALYQRAVAMMGTMEEQESAVWASAKPENPLECTVRTLLGNMSVSQRLPVKRRTMRDHSEMTFRTLWGATEELYSLLFAAHDFIVQTVEIRLKQAKGWVPSSELVSQKQHLEAIFSKWHSTFEDIGSSPGSVSTPSEVEHYSLLHVIYGHYFIMLSTSLSMYETALDNYLLTFQDMIDHASRVVATGPAEQRPLFMFETRVVPSLFFVATKCRHPVIRRQAISLLRRGTKIENTWKADTMADLAEWHIGIEESGDIGGVYCSEPDQIERLPPEDSRMVWNVVTELQDSDGRPARVHRFLMWHQDESRAWSLVEHTMKM